MLFPFFHFSSVVARQSKRGINQESIFWSTLVPRTDIPAIFHSSRTKHFLSMWGRRKLQTYIGTEKLRTRADLQCQPINLTLQ